MISPTNSAIAALSFLLTPALFAAADSAEKAAPAAEEKGSSTTESKSATAEPKAQDSDAPTPKPKVRHKKKPAPALPYCPVCDGAKPGDGKTPVPPAPPKRTWFPDEPAGSFTLGTMFSDEATGAYIDGIVGLWSPETRDAFLFLNGRFHWEDNEQRIGSIGLGFRKLLPGHEVILGANAYYDHVHSEHGNDIDQLGLGLEMLTHWVDARFNYYLPEDDRFEVGHSSERHTRTSAAPGGLRIATTTDNFVRLETGLEGFNAELGFLVPGLDRFAEVRAYVGFYHYDNPFGSDFDGVKARLEARVLRGVTVGVEWWDDKQLMGGHWTAEVGVSVPFSFYNLFTGKNPFEGAGDSFKRLPRDFASRLGDPVERSHRIQTMTSGDLPDGSSTTTRFVPISQGSGQRGGGSSSGGGPGFPIE